MYDGRPYISGFLPVWMVARCSPFDVDSDTKTLCENPGINNSLESIVPVTDSEVHYRNRFCAICNGIDEFWRLQSWDLRLGCPYKIAFNFWNVLEKAKDAGCIIDFEEPDIGKTAKTCELHSYYISTCNVTGLWSAYNETIELACNAFVDYFNETYKNIFCYICNIEEFVPPSMYDCPYGHVLDNIFPTFIAVLDVNALKTTAIQDRTLDGKYCDTVTYIKDDKNVSMRFFVKLI